MWSRLALRVKLTALVVTIVAVASLTFARVAYSGLVTLFDKVTGLRAVTVAEAVASIIQGPSYYPAVHNGELNPDLLDLAGHLNKLVESGRVHRITVIRFVGETHVQHLINVPEDNTGDYRPPGAMEEIRAGDVYRERTSGYTGVELQAPGAFMGGWTPIMVDGVPVGMVLVAVDINETQVALDTANIVILTAMLIFILLSGLVAYKFATTFEKTAVTDGLMGIYNHKYFKQRLDEEIAKSKRYKQLTTLVLLDLDYFKRVNDTYGHATGDIVLKNLAKWVTDTARNTDVVCRYGGEEVAVILPHTSLAGGQEFAERLRMKVAEQIVRDPEEDAEFRVTISVGVAQWETGLSNIDLIKRADAALYHSKHEGRNRVTIYREDLLPDLEQLQNVAK